MTAVAVIQARMGSSRLPGKVMRQLGRLPVLGWLTRAAGLIPGVDDVVVATSLQAADDEIAAWCEASGVSVFRGSEHDVLLRFADLVREREPDVLLRLTADCPLLDPEVCGQVLTLLRLSEADYATNTDPRRWPDGSDCEAITAQALLFADAAATKASDREHVTSFVRNNRHQFDIEFLQCPIPNLGGRRWTLDTEDDFTHLKALTKYLPLDRPPSFVEVLNAEDKIHPPASAKPTPVANPQNEEIELSSRANTSVPSFVNSQNLLRRALRSIPLGTQTFSKAHTQMPAGASPLFLSHGRGGRVWDVDGNRYVDLVGALLPVVLGYCDSDVDEAVQRQLSNGISFSLATELEYQLAERLVETIPCAEMVRFGKNGTDATSAAIRLARAATGRDRIAVCGYHGWQDWYIGSTTRHKGVPDAVRFLTHRFKFNDLSGLEQLLDAHPGEFAAVIMEPFTSENPEPGYLEAVKDRAHRCGALLIFDEVVTGFRFRLGGAQELFGVTPDLASFGKAMGNGMPISAVVGRADVMSEMENVFYSGTFGGEALSLAAAIAVIDKMRRQPVIETLWDRGSSLKSAVEQEIADHGLADTINLNGMAPWILTSFNDHPKAEAAAIKTLFKKSMLENGVLIGSSHNLCYAHDDSDMETVIASYKKTLELIALELATGQLTERLGSAPINPIFSVR